MRTQELGRFREVRHSYQRREGRAGAERDGPRARQDRAAGRLIGRPESALVAALPPPALARRAGKATLDRRQDLEILLRQIPPMPIELQPTDREHGAVIALKDLDR